MIAIQTAFESLLSLGLKLAAQAAAGGGAGAPVTQNSMMAGSPMSDYSAAVAVYVLVIAFLVSVLLIGGILIVNLGMLSKRAEDHVGGRTPSDVGILKHSIWPEAPFSQNVLPAEEEEELSQTLAVHREAPKSEGKLLGPPEVELPLTKRQHPKRDQAA